MNDKDKEAFNEWRNSISTRLDIHDAWQAACEYKDKEQYIEGSIHESGGIKREMTWKESSDMMERMHQGAIAQLNREYERIKKFKDEIQEYKEAARSEANIVDELQAENKKLREKLETAKIIFIEMNDKDKEILEWREAARSEAEEVNKLQSENKKLREALEMVMDNTKMPHQHSDLQTRLYCLAERAREALKEVENK
jgi:hypothetical protein